MKHTNLVPQVRCQEPDCNRAMYHLHSTQTQSIYGCTMGHIRKLPRNGGQRIPVQRPPDNAA